MIICFYIQGVSEKKFEWKIELLSMIFQLQDIVQKKFCMENKPLTMLVKSASYAMYDSQSLIFQY